MPRLSTSFIPMSRLLSSSYLLLGALSICSTSARLRTASDKVVASETVTASHVRVSIIPKTKAALTGYLTTYSYGASSGCEGLTKATTRLLDSCLYIDSSYQKLVATETSISTFYFSDSACKIKSGDTTVKSYTYGACDSSTQSITKSSSKATTDLTAPRVTLR